MKQPFLLERKKVRILSPIARKKKGGAVVQSWTKKNGVNIGTERGMVWLST